ncbi:MAG: cobalamin biosynthesis protein CbiX [Verrucomicrobiae bacterium]|nr:cobalamin biosynthesis protein CbiX [Verrucomicrobiae bacterium]
MTANNEAHSPCILLVDNGSHRAESTLNLRRVAAALADETGEVVHPVSLLHSTKVDPTELDGEPAQIFEPFIKTQHREHGTNSFLVVPLFFGHSAAIYEYLPQRVSELKSDWPDLEVRIAPCLVDLDDPTDTGVAAILAAIVREKIAEKSLDRPAVTLVDHGTPRIAVNRVRNFLAGQLRDQLGELASMVTASSMERREGPEYDFNEPLLERLLGSEGFDRDVVLAMLFISPGRHAGPGGDIARICEAAEKRHPGLRTHMSDLFATHPGAIELLARRLRQGLQSDPIVGEIAPPAAVSEP